MMKRGEMDPSKKRSIPLFFFSMREENFAWMERMMASFWNWPILVVG
jgi:hypothetical protein